jgi:hypothetical protein
MPREKLDPFWHRSRVAARIWLKAQQGKPLSPRDKRLARLFAEDKGVTDRLMDQARQYWTAAYTLDATLDRKPNPCRVVVPGLELGDTRRPSAPQAL